MFSAKASFMRECTSLKSPFLPACKAIETVSREANMLKSNTVTQDPVQTPSANPRLLETKMLLLLLQQCKTL